jgi:hypothetical protein
MQVSVRFDIAGESQGATRWEAVHWRRAIVRTARGETSVPAREVARERNPAPPFPTDGNAVYVQATSRLRPRGRNDRLLRLHNRSSSANGDIVVQAWVKGRGGRYAPATGQQDAATGRKKRVGAQIAASLNSSSSEALAVESSQAKFQASVIAHLFAIRMVTATFLH